MFGMFKLFFVVFVAILAIEIGPSFSENTPVSDSSASVCCSCSSALIQIRLFVLNFRWQVPQLQVQPLQMQPQITEPSSMMHFRRSRSTLRTKKKHMINAQKKHRNELRSPETTWSNLTRLLKAKGMCILNFLWN